MKKLNEKEQLIKGWTVRINHHKKQLVAMRAFNREEEARLEKKIKVEQIQLNALKK